MKCKLLLDLKSIISQTSHMLWKVANTVKELTIELEFSVAVSVCPKLGTRHPESLNMVTQGSW